MEELSNEQYQVLFAFRCALRQYLQWSASHAAKFGLAPQQAQLLLAIRVRPEDSPPSIGELASSLQIRQHSAVGLANRAQRAGLVTRNIDPHDQRVVRIALTPQGRTVIAQLAESHLAELQLVAATLQLSDEFLENLSQQFAGLLPTPDEDTGDGTDGDDDPAPEAADISGGSGVSDVSDAASTRGAGARERHRMPGRRRPPLTAHRFAG
jgi:DNA-binding MarR family transcriptional regulator